MASAAPALATGATATKLPVTTSTSASTTDDTATQGEPVCTRKAEASSVASYKEPQTRTYDKDGFRLRAGCVCLRTKRSEVLLVSTMKKHGKWKIPAGGVDPGEDVETCAARETWEEVHESLWCVHTLPELPEAHVRQCEQAGVRGTLAGSLGVFENNINKTRSEIFVMDVTSESAEWPESKHGRRRKWFALDDATMEAQVKQQGIALACLAACRDFVAAQKSTSAASTTTSHA